MSHICLYSFENSDMRILTVAVSCQKMKVVIYLLFLFYEANDKESKEEPEDEDDLPPKSEETDAQKLAITNFERNWTNLQGIIQSINNIEPILVDCGKKEDAILDTIVSKLEGK